MKGHQPLDRFCWKMEILSVPSLSMSALHDLAVFVPRVKLWRSISTVPAHKRHEAGCSVTLAEQRADVWDDAQGAPDAPRKSSEESLSKSHTCRTRMAGSFCSVLSSEKMLSLFVTTTT